MHGLEILNAERSKEILNPQIYINGIINMTYSLPFWLQMSESITPMDTDNYMTIHHKRTSYFDPSAYLVFCSLV